MAETPNVMPQLHMPLQSGSDRSSRPCGAPTATRFLGILDKVRAAIPDAAITTDIIVGFPGETEEDFQETLDVVARPGSPPPSPSSTPSGREHPPPTCTTSSPRRLSRNATNG